MTKYVALHTLPHSLTLLRMTVMGAHVVRVLRSVNLEARAHREIGRNKPKVAPRHGGADHQSNSDPTAVSELNRKDFPLLNRLRQVYVDSKDPQTSSSAGMRRQPIMECRPHSVSLVPAGMCDFKDVPMGKLTVLEALMALNKHKLTPQEWPAERIAQELMLTHSDAHALTYYFIPFNITVFKDPKNKDTRL